ncbi:hypothetical protein CR513_50237, partial [Mucuna pruriens]
MSKDEEALEASFQALEIVGTTNVEPEGRNLKPSKVTIMVTKVLINNGYQSSKGLGKGLEGIAKPIRIQENLGRSGLCYIGATKGGIAMKDSMDTAKPLSLLHQQGHRIPKSNHGDRKPTYRPSKMDRITPKEHLFLSFKTRSNNNINIETFTQIDNATLKLDDAGESCRQDKEEGLEEDSLVELQRLLEQEGPKLQSRVEELEIINLGKEGETKEIKWNVGFLAVVEYPQWMANIVLVPKKDEKVRMCVDYRDLNRASPKDNFPLRHIDILVDNTAQHAFYSFMDGFSRYNQIRMA